LPPWVLPLEKESKVIQPVTIGEETPGFIVTSESRRAMNPSPKRRYLERLRLGYWVMIREGSIRKELPGVKGIFKKKIDFRKLILTTDGVDPEDLLKERVPGCLSEKSDETWRPAGAGLSDGDNQCAEHFTSNHLIGSLSPGEDGGYSNDPISKRIFTPDGDVRWESDFEKGKRKLNLGRFSFLRACSIP